MSLLQTSSTMIYLLDIAAFYCGCGLYQVNLEPFMKASVEDAGQTEVAMVFFSVAVCYLVTTPTVGWVR